MRILALFLIAFIFLPFLTGCWNRRELNELALVVGMSIDKSGDKYLISTQVVDPGEVSISARAGGRAPVTTYDEKGKHLFEAIRRMTTSSPRKLYFSHLQMLVISEKVAKDGLNNILDFFSRDNEFRKDFYIVVTKDIEAKEILRNLTSIEKIPAHKMRSSLETSEKAWAPTIAIQLDELLSSLTSEGINPVLTGISIHGNAPKGGSVENVQRIEPFARLKYQNIAVFKKDKLIGWLNEKESKGYNYIRNNVHSTVGHIPCVKKGELIMEVIRSKTKVKGRVVNGKPKIEIINNMESNIGEVACHIDLTNPETIKNLEKNNDKVNVDIIETAIRKAKRLGVDIFGFGEVIHRADPKAWKHLKTNWDQEFVNVPVTIHSNVKIRRTGSVNQSFLQLEKE
jgi:spore germination protein KC